MRHCEWLLISFGFMWSCPWRVEWKRRYEYWHRSQFGPFYVLHWRRDGAV